MIGSSRAIAQIEVRPTRTSIGIPRNRCASRAARQLIRRGDRLAVLRSTTRSPCGEYTPIEIGASAPRGDDVAFGRPGSTLALHQLIPDRLMTRWQ